MDGRKSVDSWRWFGGCRAHRWRRYFGRVLRLIGGVRRVALMRARAEIFKFSARVSESAPLSESSRITIYTTRAAREGPGVGWLDRVSGLMKANSLGGRKEGRKEGTPFPSLLLRRRRAVNKPERFRDNGRAPLSWYRDIAFSTDWIIAQPIALLSFSCRARNCVKTFSKIDCFEIIRIIWFESEKRKKKTKRRNRSISIRLVC